MNKEDSVKKLHEDPSFIAILAAAKSDEERRFIKSFTEGYVANLAGLLSTFKETFESNPEEFKKQLEEIQAGVVINTQPAQPQDKKKDDAKQ